MAFSIFFAVGIAILGIPSTAVHAQTFTTPGLVSSISSSEDTEYPPLPRLDSTAVASLCALAAIIGGCGTRLIFDKQQNFAGNVAVPIKSVFVNNELLLEVEYKN